MESLLEKAQGLVEELIDFKSSFPKCDTIYGGLETSKYSIIFFWSKQNFCNSAYYVEKSIFIFRYTSVPLMFPKAPNVSKKIGWKH